MPAPQFLTFFEAFKKYETKLNETLEKIHELYEADSDNEDLDLMSAALVAKAKRYAAIMVEINLKKKLTMKRSLNLCLNLLKQCRVNINDRNLVDICVTLIQPAIQNNEDIDNFLLGLEAVG